MKNKIKTSNSHSERISNEYLTKRQPNYTLNLELPSKLYEPFPNPRPPGPFPEPLFPHPIDYYEPKPTGFQKIILPHPIS